MATANSTLNIAAGELGYSRFTDPAEGTIYGRWYAQRTRTPYYGTSGVPYCAMFVSWALSKAGTSLLPNGAVYAYCPYMERDARKYGRLRSFDDIQPGDVLLFDWDGDGLADHTGFAVYRSGNHVHTIEGNTSAGAYGSQSNGGGVYRRVRHRSTICAVIRPVYGANVVTAPQRLVVDGVIGSATISALQAFLKTPVDGVISGQTRAAAELWLAAGNGWQFNDGDGSTCIERLQKILGVTPDGYAGVQTIKALQARLGVTADGYAGAQTAKALQTALNNRRL